MIKNIVWRRLKCSGNWEHQPPCWQRVFSSQVWLFQKILNWKRSLPILWLDSSMLWFTIFIGLIFTRQKEKRKNVLETLNRNGCCGFFGLLGRVLKVVLPNVSPVSVAGIFRGQQTDYSFFTFNVQYYIFVSVWKYKFCVAGRQAATLWEPPKLSASTRLPVRQR